MMNIKDWKIRAILLSMVLLLNTHTYAIDEYASDQDENELFIKKLHLSRTLTRIESVRVLDQYERLKDCTPPASKEYYSFLDISNLKEVIEAVKTISLDASYTDTQNRMPINATTIVRGVLSLDYYYLIAKYDERIPNAWNDMFILFKHDPTTGALKSIYSNIAGLSRGGDSDLFLAYWMIELCCPIWNLDDITNDH